MTEARNYDSKSPQVVSIDWSRMVVEDQNATIPDQMGDGFWPSRDPKAAGYIGEHTPAEFEAALMAANNRMAAWARGDWQYVAVTARAEISIPTVQGSFITFTIDSPGAWGVESDSGEYLDNVFEDEKADLLSNLKTLAAHILTL